MYCFGKTLQCSVVVVALKQQNFPLLFNSQNSHLQLHVNQLHFRLMDVEKAVNKTI